MADDRKTFLMSGDHLILLSAANVRWGGIEWGAPAVDGKRPYGNGDLIGDICDLLEWQEDPEDPEVRERAERLHRETEIALQIVLATETFEPGRYEASKYGHDWKRVRA